MCALDTKIQSSNKVNKEISEKLRAERTKLRMIGFELEKSLEDELILKKQYSSLEYEFKLSKDLLHDQEKQLLELRSQQSKKRADQQFKFSIMESLSEISKAVELALSSKQGTKIKRKNIDTFEEEIFDQEVGALDDRIQQLLLRLRHLVCYPYLHIVHIHRCCCAVILHMYIYDITELHLGVYVHR